MTEPIWKLVQRCAEKLTENGAVPFTRGDLIRCVQRAQPECKAGSLHPIIQGLTDNLRGGAPGALGKDLLHSVGRGLFVLKDSDAARPSTPSPGDSREDFAPKPPTPPKSPRVTADDLARYKRCLEKLLDQVENRIPREKPVPRIRRLGRTRKLPRKIEPLMLTVAEVRNASEHDPEPPTRAEMAAAQVAWEAIVEWATAAGLRIPEECAGNAP